MNCSTHEGFTPEKLMKNSLSWTNPKTEQGKSGRRLPSQKGGPAETE